MAVDWFCTSTGAGAHDGSTEGNAFDLAEAISEINTPVEGWADGDTMWIKGDATHNTGEFAVTNPGGALAYSKFKGYTTNIGDGGKATLKRNAGAGILIDWLGAAYWHIENIIIDGNSSGTLNFRGAGVYSWLKNVESKNAGANGFNNGRMFNCYAHNNGGQGFDRVISAINCIAESNGSRGFTNGQLQNCISKGNTAQNYYLDGMVGNNLISDGGSENGFSVLRCSVYNSIAINAPAGKYGLQVSWGGNFYNINFYNCDGDDDPADAVTNKYTLDPQFNAPASLDYTRTGTNLDDLGFSEVGMVSGVDYNIDIGIDQKTAGGEQSHAYIE